MFEDVTLQGPHFFLLIEIMYNIEKIKSGIVPNIPKANPKWSSPFFTVVCDTKSMFINSST